MAKRFLGSSSFRLGVGALLVAAVLAAILLTRRTPPVATHTIEARLELAAGQVTLRQGAAWPTVISGIPLPDGAELATGKGARALVRLADGSAVFLRGDSRIALGRTGLDLAQGEIWLDAPAVPRGGLTHKLGSVSVSATDAGLSLRHDGNDSSVYVTRGLAIVVAPGGRVEVNAGEQASIAGGEAPKLTSVKYWEDWTGGMGDHHPMVGAGSGSGRIYGVDRSAIPGSPARTLEISRQVVKAVIRDGLAETEVDQTFGNPGGREVEGFYWFTVPERAVVTSFAVETDGSLVEGEVIERRAAAGKYQAAVRAAHEPALLEWVDGQSYRARIFPVPASGSRRVVLRYLELLGDHGDRFQYVYPLRATDTPRSGRGGSEAATIGEFALTVDLGSAGVGMPLATLADAVIEEGGRRVTMRRSGYTPRADFQLEGSLRHANEPLRATRFAAGGDRADYVMARFTPEEKWADLKDVAADLVVVVDTSASADDAARQQKAGAAEAVLRAMSPSDHFALVALDTVSKILFPSQGLAEASEKEIASALERLAEHASGGATDLGSMFDAALGRLHGKEQPAIIYIGDGLATSGEVAREQLAERLRRSLATSRARFFTVAVGPNANHALLGELSRAGGGQPFRIDDAEGSTAEVLRLASAIKTPTITDLAIDLGAGLDEPMLTASGKVSRGEEVILLARTHHPLPETATVKGRLSGKDFEKKYRVKVTTNVATALVPRLWAAEKVRRLLGEATDPEEQRGKVVELGVEYGLMTPFTSILALESEQAYLQQGIPRRQSPLRGVRLTSLTPAEERSVVAGLLPPEVVMGCSKSEPDTIEVRAKGEEGSMGKADHKEGGTGARASGRYGVSAPAPAAVAQSQESQQAQALDRAQAPSDPAPEPAKDLMAPGAGVSGLGLIGGGTSGLKAKVEEAENKTPSVRTRPAMPPAVAAPVSPRLPPLKPNSLGFGPLQEHLRGTHGGTGEKPTRGAPLPVVDSKKVAPPPPKPPQVRTCSDSARRPLAERIVLWRNRLRQVSSADELMARYDDARAMCEITDWRAEAALLDLIQAKVQTEGTAEALLSHFAGSRETQRFIARAILRRSVDDRIAAVVRRVLFEDRVRWIEVDNELAALKTPEERLLRLRQIRVSFPDDPEGEVRLVRALAQAKQKDEALALGRRLRERGFMSPALSLTLGDVLADSGYEDDAIRTYSEIVEFDPGSADSRRLLGDVYLRRVWYAAAYRQYKTLTDIAGNDPANWLRLAAAAAGIGRVDEALRIDRQVAAAEGTPGPNDPRVWARLLSASRLSRLLGDPATPPAQAESVSRKLKELGVFSGPAGLCILTWEDYAAQLSLVPLDGDKDSPLGEATAALPVGLTALLVASGDLERLKWAVRWRSDAPGRDVAFVIHQLAWDGKAFRVTLKRGALSATDKQATL